MKVTLYTGIIGLAACLALGACGDGERTATAETSVAEAEVSTTMPEAAVTDAQLEASANRAVANASQPAPGTLTPEGQVQPNTTEMAPAQ